MAPGERPREPVANGNAFGAKDVVAILRERGWLATEPSAAQIAWCERAASLLGSHAADRNALAELLALIFHYDAAKLLAKTETHAVLARYAARDVLRKLALLLLDDAPLTSDLFKKVISCLKDDLDLRGRELFHPLRLALAGRAGEGELDRVILLLDEAAGLSFGVPVKQARERILEFCAALD
jgi:nondiscriminating glutamyl-tRNA synthetase